jgi:transcriptional regulator with XRE-family HTH domain
VDAGRSDAPIERLPALVVLGRNLYRRRILRIPRMSQKQLAEVSGVAVNTIGALESARNPEKAGAVSFPQLDTIEELARALGCTVADLLDEEAAYSSGWSIPGYIDSDDQAISQPPLVVAVR